MMPGLENLLALQRIDGRLEILRRELQGRPGVVSEQEQAFASIEGRRREIAGKQLELQKSIDRVELDGKAIEAKIAESETRLGQVSSNAEFQGLQSQIARFQEERNEIDERILLLWGEKEELEQAIAQCERDADEVQQRLAESRKEVEADLETIRVEAQELLERRDTARGPIDGEILAHYDTLFSRYRARSIVSAEGGVCAGCHMSLSPQVLASLKGEREIVSCNNCSRILYL